MKTPTLALLALCFTTAANAAIPAVEFTLQSLRQGVQAARSEQSCGSLFVIQAIQACAAVRAADQNGCEALVPPAARNLCFGIIKARANDPCDDLFVSGVREQICAGARKAFNDKSCHNLQSATATKYCQGLLP